MMLELKMSFAIGFIAVLPIVFFYAYRFLAGRQIGERIRIRGRSILLVTAIALVLFAVGCAYSYLLMLPLVFKYLMDSALAAGVANSWRVSEFINFAMLTTLTFGLVFELPLVMTALARARIVPVAIFKKYRRHMWVIILIVAALVTSPDILTQVMVGVPLIIFYELSLILLRFTAPAAYRRSKETTESAGTQFSVGLVRVYSKKPDRPVCLGTGGRPGSGARPSMNSNSFALRTAFACGWLLK